MFLLTTSTMFPSARAIRNMIEQISGERLRIRTEVPNLGTIAIRWGNGNMVMTNAKDRGLNSTKLIRVFSNKKLFSDLFKDDIWVPIFRRDTPKDSDFPLLIRTTLSGFGGKGIIPCSDIQEFNRRWDNTGYWTKYIELSSEFRVHVFDGEILRIFKKVKEAHIAEESKFNIRNSDRGWHFESVGNAADSLLRLRETTTNFCKLAAKKLETAHAYFALDVGWNNKEKKYFILEGNTAPGVVNNNNTLVMYANKFVEVLGL